MVTKTIKEVAKMLLRDVLPDKVFWFHDGRVVKHLDKLPTTLRGITEEA
jgi:hypothetical protein